MIADKVMDKVTKLDRRGFSVGNIAPDFNVENEDWTAFIPSREITHWMSGKRKVASDSDAFCEEYIIKRKDGIKSEEQYSFLLGYYTHLITDASFQKYIRDEKRVRDVWSRIKADAKLQERAKGYSEDWDSIKKIFPMDERVNEMYSMEAEYLRENPESGYLTEILLLKEFPDYIDYLPAGSIVRKIGVMGYMPEVDESITSPITISRDEYKAFVEDTVELVVSKFRERELI